MNCECNPLWPQGSCRLVDEIVDDGPGIPLGVQSDTPIELFSTLQCWGFAGEKMVWWMELR
jgi:hypothetical protein